jgi:hypothetical protein
LTVVAFANPGYHASKFVYTNPSAPQGFFRLAREDEEPPLLKLILGKESTTCIYAPSALNSTITNGSPTEMFMSGKWKLLEDSAKGACPTVLASSSHLSMTRTSEELPLYIGGKEGVEEETEKEEEKEGGGEEEKGSTGTVLCKSAPGLKEGVLDCPAGEGFSGKVTGTVVPKTLATFASASGPKLTVTCPEGYYVGEFNADGTSAGKGISDFRFGQKEGCTTTWPEGPEAVVSFENPPYGASRFVYTNRLAPEGSFILAKPSEGQVLLRIESSSVCVYLPNALESSVTNGSPSEMFMLGKWKLAEEAPEGTCPTVLASSAHLTVTRMGEGLPLYIAGE